MRYRHTKLASALAKKLMAKLPSPAQKAERYAAKKMLSKYKGKPTIRDLATRREAIRQNFSSEMPAIRKLQLAEARDISKEIAKRQREREGIKQLAETFASKGAFKKLPEATSIRHIRGEKALGPIRQDLHQGVRAVDPLKAEVLENISVEPLKKLPEKISKRESPKTLDVVKSKLLGRIPAGTSEKEVARAIKKSRRPLTDVDKARVQQAARRYEGKTLKDVSEDIPKIEARSKNIDQRLSRIGLAETSLKTQRKNANILEKQISREIKEVNSLIKSSPLKSNPQLQERKRQLLAQKSNVKELQQDISDRLGETKASTGILETQYRPQVSSDLSTARNILSSGTEDTLASRLGLGLGLTGAAAIPAAAYYYNSGVDPEAQILEAQRINQEGLEQDPFYSEPVSESDPTVEQYFRGI